MDTQTAYFVWGYEAQIDDEGNMNETYYRQMVNLDSEDLLALEGALKCSLLYGDVGSGFFVIEGDDTREVIGDIDDTDLEIYEEKCMAEGVKLNLEHILSF